MISIETVASRAMPQVEMSRAAFFASCQPLSGNEALRAAPVVHIIDMDDDAQVLSGWLMAAGLNARNYIILDDFMEAEPRDTPSCLVIDAGIACRDHADLGAILQRLGVRCPIVMTAYGADIPTAVLAMKTGVIDFLPKPFRQQDVLHAVGTAIAVDRERRLGAARKAALSARFATLTQRERQVMALVATGKLNKQVAGDLGISEITVKAHRGVVMRKMDARSLADLVRMADAILA